MAAGMASAFDDHGFDDVDDDRSYIPHRAPPPIPTVAYSSTSPRKAPEFQRSIGQVYPPEVQQQQQQQYSSHTQPSPPSTLRHPAKSTSGHTKNPSVASTDGGARRGSFGFLRRTSTNTSSQQQNTAPAGGVPATSPGSGSGLFLTKSNEGNSKSESRSMLRKSSKLRAEQERLEQERLAALAQAQQRPPPRLPSHSPLPNIGTFGGDDARPDSVAMFNHAYTDPNTPPAIPQGQLGTNFSRPGQMPSTSSPSNYNSSSSSPAYALRGQGSSHASSPGPNGEFYDAAGEKTNSMTNRGRYSYASTMAQGGNVNSPRRVRRRKDPTPFNLLFVGTKNSGKTSFISFLRQSLALPANKQSPADQTPQSVTKGPFTSHYLESDLEGERVGLTLWDSPGLEKNVVDLQLREMTTFIEAKFEETFTEEQKVMRSPGFKDTHIHCVILVLDPVRLDATVAAASNGESLTTGVEGLDEDLDLQVLRALWGKTTVIPVIAKADTLTQGHMAFLKKAVWHSIKTAKLNPLEALELDDEDDEEESEEADEEEESSASEEDADKIADESVVDNLLDRSSSEESEILPKPKRASAHVRQASLGINNGSADEEPYVPMSILSPDPYDLPPYTKQKPKSQSEVGRRFAWGFASPYNPEHCDFIRLRDTIFSEWRADLRELSRVRWYEHWRTSRLRNIPGSKQRVKGGVTPVASVPKGGMTYSSGNNVRNFSGSGSAVPRTVSGHTGGIPAGLAHSSPAPEGESRTTAAY